MPAPEICGTREIPEWEREFLDRFGENMIMNKRPWESRPEPTFIGLTTVPAGEVEDE